MSDANWSTAGRPLEPSPHGAAGPAEAARHTAVAEAAGQLPVIAHVLHRLHVGGAEVLAAELARRLHERFRFIFLCLDGIGPLGESLRQEGFTVLDLERRPGIDWAAARRLRQAVERYGIQLLHAHQYSPFFYAALARRFQAQPPILFTEHGRHYPDKRRLRRVWANRLLLRCADQVTAVGQFVKQALVEHEGIAQDRIEVVPNGIDPLRYISDRDRETRRAVRADLGLSAHQPMILQVARFHPVKDHATAVRALAEVIEEIPETVLVLAGDGQQREHVEALVHQLEIASHVHFLGVRSDIPRLMSAADVFLLSSLSEGVSVTLLEAMGCQLPIVATDVGGNAEVVGDGEAGLLSPRGKPAPLAENIMRLLRDPLLRLRLGQRGRRRLLGQFTQDKMHARYAEIYGRMVGV